MQTVLRTVVLALILSATIFFFSSCGSSGSAAAWRASMGPVPRTAIAPMDLYRQINVKSIMIPKGRYGRRKGIKMNARYITIHSTQNYTGDAYAHAKALSRGALRGGTYGYLCWHFTVQDNVAIQHMPTNERGEHADFTGPGNTYSIGIEMAEHKGNNMPRTLDRTAQLAASLMYYHNIPIENVVPHYHWPRYKYKTPHKPCPHFLMDNGRPGPTWRWFRSRVQDHYNRMIIYQRLSEKS